MDPIVRLDRVEIHPCHICSYGSMSLHSYTKHITTHLFQTKVILKQSIFYECDKCYCAFLTNQALKLHIVNHVIANSLKEKNEKTVLNIENNCKIVGGVQKGNEVHNKIKVKSRKRKKRGTIPVKLISCNVCDKKYRHWDMKRHAEEMHSDVPYSCKHCYLRFTTNELLKEHQNTIHRKIPCTICGKLLLNKYSLHVHLKLHSANPRPYPCSVCGKSFTQRSSLNDHLKRHYGLRDFECKYCEKKFYSRDTLKNHTRTHTGDKPFVCQYCNKPFGDVSASLRHERIHTKEYRYFCTECPDKFTDISSLRQHKVKHADNDNQSQLQIKCDNCDRYFSDKVKLNYHIARSHQGKKFECNDCGRKYAIKALLYIHIQKDHRQGVECVYCNKMFGDKENLQIHKNKFHPIILYCSTCPKKFYSEKSFQAHKLLCSKEK